MKKNRVRVKIVSVKNSKVNILVLFRTNQSSKNNVREQLSFQRSKLIRVSEQLVSSALEFKGK